MTDSQGYRPAWQGFDWALPGRLNMAEQALRGPGDQVAIIDLTGGARRDVTRDDLRGMVDGLARYLAGRVARGDRVGVLFSQSPWCAATHLAIWKIRRISAPLFMLFKCDALPMTVTGKVIRKDSKVRAVAEPEAAQ